LKDDCALAKWRVVQLINPVLRGSVNYFAVGHSSKCFSLIKDWVEKKVRRHMLRARAELLRHRQTKGAETDMFSL
jgi:hypothetical protein